MNHADLAAHDELAARAARSIRLAVPLVRKPARFWPDKPGDVALCKWLAAFDAALLAFLAFSIWSR